MDKDKIVAGVRDTTIVIYDRQTLEERRRLRGHTYGALHCTSMDQIVLIVEATIMLVAGVVFMGARGSVLCLQYDDSKIVSGSSDASVKVATSACAVVSREHHALTLLLDL